MLNFDWTKRSHKGLRKWILYIVSASPKSGAEMMDVMEANLQGWWRPSPGSVYPLLRGMVEEGVLSRSSDNKYSLTRKGKEEIENPFPWLGQTGPSPRSVEGALEEMSSYTAYLEDLSQAKDSRVSEKRDSIRELGERLARVASGQ